MTKQPVNSGSAVLECFADESSAAAIRLVAELCRMEPELRTWLWMEFAKDEKVRDRFAQLIEAPSAKMNSVDSFAYFNGEDSAWRIEQKRLRGSINQPPGMFGGLTWTEMEQAFRQYEAGSLDLGSFMLAQDWNEAKRTGRTTPELMRASVAFLGAAARDDKRLLNHFHRALAVVERSGSPRERRAMVGYSEWWKLQALRYMLRHPRPAYRTRDVRAYLATLGLEVSSLDFRRFCNRHGIRRDTRPGRPRTRVAEN